MNGEIEFMVDDVLSFHEDMASLFAMEKGVRDFGLLESAVSAPFQSFGGVELYPTVTEKAARLCYGLAKNHPFFDGNKRTALHTMLVYLAVHGLALPVDDEELEGMIIDVACGKMDLQGLSRWLDERVTYDFGGTEATGNEAVAWRM